MDRSDTRQLPILSDAHYHAPVSSRHNSVRTSQHCRNCGAPAPEHYCPRCGQETHEKLPTAREFVHEFALHYFAAEGSLWRTLRALVLHPGRLTLEYLRGRKLAYVLPLRLYLTISVVFFLTLQIVMAPTSERLSTEFHRSLTDGKSTFSIIDTGFGKAIRNPDGSFTCDLARWICKRIEDRLLKPPGELEKRLSNLPAQLLHNMSTAMFLLLPLFAGYLQLAYLKRNFGEHFLFALHLHSMWFLGLLLMLLPMPPWLQTLIEIYLFLYSVVALHEVYRAAWWKTVLKALAIGCAYSVSLIAATVLIAIYAIIE